MSQSLSQAQFGANAAEYLTSKPHAEGKSLERLVALAQPQAHWHVLDVATGAGHTAYAFAPHVARVWASDITDEMLNVVRAEVTKRGLGNVRLTHAKAEALPFEDGAFDLVTCRVAPHHFDSIPLFLDETRRVLKNDGTLALVDNVVPPGSVGDYVNAFERFRDPSHLRAWTVDEWRAALKQHGFTLIHEETLSKEMDFAYWAGRHDAVTKAYLRALLEHAAPAVTNVLQPQAKNGGLTFRLSEAVFIARTPVNG
jgi:ubiquinone/menaquinone biosynthesis C-methylase UbiE